jgi:hypothetical protein
MLLSQSTEPQHLIFSLLLGKRIHSGHVFAVEKHSDGKTTFWRLYQSFLGRLTLNEWLGNTPYKKGNTFIEEDIKKYGCGKKMNSEELKEILVAIFDNDAISGHAPVQIKVYPTDLSPPLPTYTAPRIFILNQNKTKPKWDTIIVNEKDDIKNLPYFPNK